MYIVTLINFLVIILAYIARTKKFRWCLGFSLIVACAFFSIRYNYGNDYMSYLTEFNSINSYCDIEVSDAEIGWTVLNRLFGPLGFNYLIAFLTVFQYFTLYWFIKRYVKPDFWYIIIAIYFLSASLNIVMISALRQALAMSILILSVPSILSRRWYFVVLFILISSLFHKSSLILLPFVPFLGYLNAIKPRLFSVLMIASYVGIYVMMPFVEAQITSIIDLYFSKYDVSLDIEDERSIGIGWVINIILFIFLIWLQERDPNNIFLKIWIVSFLFVPLGSIIPIFARIRYYFILLGINGVLALYVNRKVNPLSYAMCLYYFMVLVYGYFSFFSNPIYAKAYSRYSTIIGNH